MMFRWWRLQQTTLMTKNQLKIIVSYTLAVVWKIMIFFPLCRSNVHRSFGLNLYSMAYNEFRLQFENRSNGGAPNDFIWPNIMLCYSFYWIGFFSFFLIWIYLNNYYFKQLCAYNSVNERVSAQQWPPPNRFGQWILLLDFAYFIALFGYFN